MSIEQFNTKRMLTEKEAIVYTSLKRNTIRKLGAELKCVHHYGRRILYDRKVIDAYFDSLGEGMND